MADFEDDVPRSVLLYQKSLNESEQFELPRQGILTCMAERMINLNQFEQAEAALLNAEQLARAENDDEVLGEIDRVREKLASK
jgi:hypothetical protein